MIQERIMRLLKVYHQRKLLIDRMEQLAFAAYQQGNETYSDRVFDTRERLVYRLWDMQSVLEFCYCVSPIKRRYLEDTQ